MEINNDLVVQWEPKVQKMASSAFIVGMDKEDLAQELRISLLKAAKAYDEGRGISFHTYLHTSLVNTIRTLISKAQRRPISKSIDDYYEFYDNDNPIIPKEIQRALRAKDTYAQEIELDLLISSQHLSKKERQFLKLKFEGLTMDEITDDLRACRICIYCLGYRTKDNELGVPDLSNCLDKQGDGAYKIRNALREKFRWLDEKLEIETDS